MRLFFSVSTFAVTMFISLAIFAYLVVAHPTTARGMVAAANSVRDVIINSGTLPDSYMVFADVLIQASQLVLIFISIMVRLAIAVIGSIFTMGGGNSDTPATPVAKSSPNNSYFSRWG